MATKNALNKNSVYVSSLVNFILDTKPYHSKLTEIVEEYQFFDDVKVKFNEKFTSRSKISATWLYNYFSSANEFVRSNKVKRVVSPSFTTDNFTVGIDENTDLSLVPFAYSKKSFDNAGISGAFLKDNKFTQRLTESVDYFQSHGSFQFQIKQTRNAMGQPDPQWVSTDDDGILAYASEKSKELAYDVSSPSSAINRIRALLDEIQDAVIKAGGHYEVQNELTGSLIYNKDIPPTPESLYGILNSVNLPRSYEALFAWLATPNNDDIVVPLPALDSPVTVPPHDRQWFEEQFSNNTSPLFFNLFSDMGIRESGKISFPTTTQSNALKLTNISISQIEEWTLICDNISGRYRIQGSLSGFAGFVSQGASFNNGKISFKTQAIGPAVVGDTISLLPTKKLVIDQDAPLETWNIIKVNPIAHNKPIFISTSLGFIQDLSGVKGSISILDSSLESMELILIARADGETFDIIKSSDSSYVKVAKAGVTYNDGEIGFTIVPTSRKFYEGERFNLIIENLPPAIQNLEIGYGYDLDPYDDDTSSYTNPHENQLLGFYYDGRFTDYDLSLMNIALTEKVQSIKFRLRAINSNDSELIKEVDNNRTPGEKLRIYYANSFNVEISSDDFATKQIIGNVPIGGTFENEEYGISFKIPEGSKPFISSAIFKNSSEEVMGGDIISFEVKNPAPTLLQSPVSLISSINRPQLQMHSDSFVNCPAAKWTITFINEYEFKLVGIQPDGNVIAETTGDIRKAKSFKQFNIHFSIFPGHGFTGGDKFAFDTFNTKASLLVHGSVTGWTAPAEIGKFYWNGKIGFIFEKPRGDFFLPVQVSNNVQRWNAANLDIPFTLLDDCPALSYVFTKVKNGFTVVRSDTGEINFCEKDGVYSDRYLTIDLLNVNETEFKLLVDASDLRLWNSADLIILNSTNKSIKNGNILFVEKTKNDKFSLNLTYGSVNLSDLGPISIDQRFIGIDVNNPVAINNSPETLLLNGWIPTTSEKLLIDDTIGEFCDPITKYKIKSSVSNEDIGILKSYDNSDNSVSFEWDLDFFKKYLPLDAEANLVISNSGWNDKLTARISESIKFLLGPGALAEDWMFHDDVNINIDEDHKFNIFTSLKENFGVNVDDGPFAGFLPGYDTLPYQFETGEGDINDPNTGGSYDLGHAPDIYSLFSKVNITDQERKDFFDMWNNYLLSPELPTTEEQWAYLRQQLELSPNKDILFGNGFGIPYVGMVMDIVDKPLNSADTNFTDVFSSISNQEGNHFDVYAFDSNEYDEQSDLISIVDCGKLPISPTIIPINSTYDSFTGGIQPPVAAIKHTQKIESDVWYVPTKLVGKISEFTVVDVNGNSINPVSIDIFDNMLTVRLSTPAAGQVTAFIMLAARNYELSFTADNSSQFDNFIPNVSIWLPESSLPIPVKYIEEVEVKTPLAHRSGTGTVSKKFKFSISREEAGKIILS